MSIRSSRPAIKESPAALVFLAGFFIGARSTLLQTLLIQSGTQDVRVDRI